MLDVEPIGDVIAELGDDALASSQLGKGPPGDGQRLQHGHGRHHLVGAQGVDGAVGGPLTADHRGQRDQQLTHVPVQAPVGAGRLGQVEVEQPRFARLVHEHVVTAQVAMGDPPLMETGHLLPHAVEHLVVDVLDVHVVERVPANSLLDEEDLAAGRSRREDDARDAHARL